MDDVRRRGRRNLVLIAAIFFVPVIVAFALYYGDVWRPAGSASKGELIHPARPLDVAGLRNADGTAAPADALAGKWSLIYIGDGACDADCRREPLRITAGVHDQLAIGRRMIRTGELEAERSRELFACGIDVDQRHRRTRHLRAQESGQRADHAGADDRNRSSRNRVGVPGRIQGRFHVRGQHRA